LLLFHITYPVLEKEAFMYDHMINLAGRTPRRLRFSVG
jgi:hypothetical protein